MNTPVDPHPLDICGCCEADIPEPTLYNRPGLPALAYRIGTHGTFLRRMLARLPTQTLPHHPTSPLQRLTARHSDDPAIALLDGAATILDVLSFYQGRLANEGYLRTATERRSVLELARTIGYELQPGVAASTFLAFTVEDTPGAPGMAVVPQGTKVQSLPGQGQLPQTFETSNEITARAEWNALRPRLTQPQTLSIDAKSLYLAGTTTNLKVGDWLLLVVKQPNATTPPQARRIQRVVVEQQLHHTRVDFSQEQVQLPLYTPVSHAVGVISLEKSAFNRDQVLRQVVNQTWNENMLQAMVAIKGWSLNAVDRHITKPPAPTLPPADEGVFRFRERLGCFGHNAPAHKSLPATAQWPPWDTVPRTVWEDSAQTSYIEKTQFADAFLERSIPEIVRDSWVLFEQPGAEPIPYRVDAASDSSLADYAISGKATGLRLAGVDGTSAPNRDAKFKVRTTTAHVQSEPLALAELPIDQPIAKGDTTIHLDRMVLGLSLGQPVIISGERHDLAGVLAHEVALLKDITHSNGFTSLTLQDPLQFSYTRDTVTINANVVRATHGETLHEVLGSGDGSKATQRFTLKKLPLTYVAAATASGAQSTLTVRVNGILWEETDRLFGLHERSENYLVRFEDDGKTRLIFGDGEKGARLPTGMENITATYRSGIGLVGMVGADTLTLLQTRPLGIRGVTNPLPATGAAEPENRDSARGNAPLTVLTMERIVSLPDFEDFTRAFAGIGKAQAVALWHRATQWVHLTIAAKIPAATDEAKPSALTTHIVPQTSELFSHLVEVITQASDPGQRFRIDTYQPVFFNLKARVIVKPRYLPATVLAAVEDALKAAFAFAQRAFSQPVTAAEVVTVMQGVPGVIAVDLDQLYRVDKPTPAFSDILPAERVRWPATQQEPQLAELLLINPVGITLEELQA